MTVHRFRNRDRDYLAWRAENLDGYVANIVESDASERRVHRSSC